MSRRSIRATLTGAVMAGCVLTALPAQAHDGHRASNGVDQGQYYGQGYQSYPPMIGTPWPTTVMTQPDGAQQGYPQNYQGYQGYPHQDPRWQEMDERCRKVYGDKGLGGALLGGVVGGVVGNRVAGRGNRVLGTVAGGVVGAIAGNVIDKSEDRALRRECDDYARSVQQQPAYGYPSYPAQGYAPYGYMMVPVMVPNQQPCVETTVVTERWVDAPTRRRHVPRHTPVVREKRIKEKRVYVD